SASGLQLAGGSFADLNGQARVEHARIGGKIVSSGRGASAPARGWFESADPVSNPETLAGRALVIAHGDGSRKAWTIVRASNRPDGGARFDVAEETGFLLDPSTNTANYYQFPMLRLPGPHDFVVCRLSRTREQAPADRPRAAR
ncbi:MAG TPA: hypothetical protein VFT74_08405, partial [Isosphaeraceae bacterium]|nr:hypothetical protein [Isosphaeraceae bacterium]